jgi:L-histidine N-alpha-methyltransferase
MRPSAAYAPSLPTAEAEFAHDVRLGLSATPKQLPPRWLYDAIGSSLFETICLLPWYKITRAETALLDRLAPEIALRLPAVREVVELGPGSGDKLARLLAPFTRRPTPVAAHLIDVSSEALAAATTRLSALPGLGVRSVLGTFHEGLRALPNRTGGRLIALLGSNIGNFDPQAADDLMREIAGALATGDFCLLGADLVKPEADLIDAYDDPLGVTAAFNLNVLARINRELGARFDLRAFRHHARWNPGASRVEMHLVSQRAQHVAIPRAGVDVRFAEGESIWTESSHKYTPEFLDALGARAGLVTAARWVDEDAGFALTLFRKPV